MNAPTSVITATPAATSRPASGSGSGSTDIVRLFVDGAGSAAQLPDRTQVREQHTVLCAGSVQRVESPSYRAQRPRDLVRRLPSADLLVPIVLHGSIDVVQDGRELTVPSGNGVLLRMDAPWSCSTPDASTLLVLRIPSNRLSSSTLARARHLTAKRLAGKTGERTLAAVAVGALDRPPAAFSGEAEAIEQTLAVLVESIILADPSADSGDTDLDAVLRRRALTIIDERLQDPTLSPEAVADEMGVGIRRVQRLFAAEGTGIAAEIRSARLNAMANRLKDPQADTSLRDLARAYGFAGLPQAGRAFKAEYGESMSDFRALHLG